MLTPRQFLPYLPLLCAFSAVPAAAQDASGKVSLRQDGLHGYISYNTQQAPQKSNFNAGIGFYSAVWSLIDQPLAGFQIGLPGCWILPDNRDNKNHPLAPEGTLARTWKERGPTWDSVFQTVEGGLGYWAGNHFRYGGPKFSMNATPQCYDYEVGSPGWSFFYSDKSLPDNRLGIAQLSNRLLIPPDGLPFQDRKEGQFLGYSWLALPFTEAETGDLPTGDQSWTCFLNAFNFKGPIAFYVPQTWSKIGSLFKDPFLFGRGLDARSGIIGGGAIEINTVPRFVSQDSKGVVYSRIPKLHFPVDGDGKAVLVQDVTYYSKSALYDAVKQWRDAGKACSGKFSADGQWKPDLSTSPTRYDQESAPINDVDKVCLTRVFDGNRWGMEWFPNTVTKPGEFPEYFRQDGKNWIPIAKDAVPAETTLSTQSFKVSASGNNYVTPVSLAWTTPGPRSKTITVALADGSEVTYAWYRFIDQPVFQQYHWDARTRQRLQKLVEQVHSRWTIDKEYMQPPTAGSLVKLDPGLIVKPPKGMEVGYVPIVIGQRKGSGQR